jgi:pseudouridine-5'-phosphate glycosidase
MRLLPEDVGGLGGQLVYSPEVRRALARGWPVVALESSIIAHGLPEPENFDVGCEFEAIVREAGAYPATIAVIDGRAHIGLQTEELGRIAAGVDVGPLRPRDLPHAWTRGTTGATTVAATALLAARAGIRIFATAGLGAHRARPWDDPSDLGLLGSERVTWSGPTMSIGWPERPPVGAVLIANPAFANGTGGGRLPDHVLAAALSAPDEHAAGLDGRAVTPFLLDYLTRPAEDDERQAELAAVRHNVRLAAQAALGWAGTGPMFAWP